MIRWDRRLALACAVVGTVLLLSTLAFVVADGGLGQRTAFLLLAGAALVAIYAVVDAAAIGALVRGRRSRHGSLGVVLSASVVGVLVAVNVPGSRAIQAVDLTRSSLYTLSSRSTLVVGQLDSDLQVTGFFRPDQLQARRDVQTLLDLYRQQSAHVKVRFVDPGRDAAPRLGGAALVPGSIVLQYRSKPPVVLDPARQSEADVTGAIQRLESTRTPAVCWAAGDGERDLRDTSEVSGYSAVAELLRTTGYRAQEVLLDQRGVPTACDVLVVLQLGRPLGDAVVRAIQDYLARGGKLLLAIDPWLEQPIVASVNAVLKP
ncbi:MAG TPA: Gldg family protein, partial [Candidatus Eisenbacteria bacterium]|nr:Gldg family protein [Candidatus Eisenbacteria bacterium]